MHEFFKRHKWPILVIFLFILGSYITINSYYNFAHGDAAAFARYAKSFHETNRINTKGAATALIGQLLFSRVFTFLFGYSLKVLHISVYIANLLFLIGMYLLLYELGAGCFLALLGALCVFVNPIGIKMIDWYMSEPFFLFYLVFAMLFFIKGLKKDNYLYLYLGGMLGILAILTRQHGISFSFAVILFCIVYRKRLKKGLFNNSIISASLPLLAIGLYYLTLYLSKRLGTAVPYGYAPENIIIIKSLLNPKTMLTSLYFDGLIFLHYTVLFSAPLFILLLFSFILEPKMFKGFFKRPYILLSALLYVFIGTIFFYGKEGGLMPYVPSIFSIANLTNIFNCKIINANSASILLTLFTGIGAVIILYYILDHVCLRIIKDRVDLKDTKGQSIKGKKDKKVEMKNQSLESGQIKEDSGLGKRFMYIWGIVYILTTILMGLRYDRYVFPLSIFTVFLILSHFEFTKEVRPAVIASFITILAIFFFVFMFNMSNFRFALEVEWEAGEYLLKQGIPSLKINSGLGFNNYYSFDKINDLYKEFNTQRPINWQKFHPLADYFVSPVKGLDRMVKGLTLYETISHVRWYSIFKQTYYIYKRKNGYFEPIWL